MADNRCGEGDLRIKRERRDRRRVAMLRDWRNRSEREPHGKRKVEDQKRKEERGKTLKRKEKKEKRSWSRTKHEMSQSTKHISAYHSYAMLF